MLRSISSLASISATLTNSAVSNPTRLPLGVGHTLLEFLPYDTLFSAAYFLLMLKFGWSTTFVKVVDISPMLYATLLYCCMSFGMALYGVDKDMRVLVADLGS